MKNQINRQSATAVSTLRKTTLACLAAIGVATALVPLNAIAASGKFSFVTGSVFIETNGRRVPAVAGAEVNPGDIIIAGADGMAQLSMIDQARLSLRSNSQLRIDSYQRRAGDQDGAVLSLLRGTLRTFTGLLTSSNREKYQMKTRVATVGIRGSGNILSHEEDDQGGNAVTLNHTIEGSHIVNSLSGNFAPIISFPNDTVKVTAGKPPEKIPTPPSITSASNTMIGTPQKKAADEEPPAPLTLATSNPQSATGTGGGNDGNVPGSGSTTVVTQTFLPAAFIAPDPSGLRDIVLAGSNTTYSGQATPAGTTFDGVNLRGFTAASGGFGAAASIAGGTIAESGTVDIGNGSTITFGRWNSPTNVNFAGLGSFSGLGATTHFAYGGAGFPAYLADVLTGTVAYTRVGATSPTDQSGVTGTLTSTLLSVNFTSRLLNATIALAMPVAGANPAANYTLQATNVPFTLNSFFAITGFGLTVTNNTTNQSSSNNSRINGTVEGSFVGAALSGAIMGYSLQDGTVIGVPNSTSRNVGGVIAFQAPAQNTNAPFRLGLISDPTTSLAASQYSQTYSTINRPEEITTDATGRVSAFRGPFARAEGTIDNNQRYAQGSAQVLDSGVDATTGLSWGRWSGGSATIGGVDTSLASRSQHYLFSAAQTGPTTLPLTGTAVYEVAGSTRPTDSLGNVGTFNSATLNANFSARTVDATVNVTIANQTWNASAAGMPIYRDLNFAANTGRSPGGGLPAPTQLNITCTPNCGGGAIGSFDGFFTGATGQGAGLMYNINRNIAGAVAFRRRGG